ncbi:hypothetical protein A5893_17330 [Pedobacter psychrophilus]|uniref:Uncharacterized protein n=1 Tax=Pedobacter psychrophilus TaxID=1826909 RepID=A0A179DPM2_9SPHI|nr:hypothetical protein [Pedobacter psychrophilus]OAQ42818.1 hypothetical protein A5893_17330 [Pedobacter psychrophilus]
MIDLNLIISCVFLITYVVVFLFQKSVIKGQKELNKTLTDKMLVLEKFQNIFDLDKFEKYVKVLKETHQQDLDQAFIARTSETVRAVVNKAYKDLPKELSDSYYELLKVTYITIMQYEKETQEMMLMLMPINEEMIRDLMASGRIPHKP